MKDEKHLQNFRILTIFSPFSTVKKIASFLYQFKVTDKDKNLVKQNALKLDAK
jgi:hypothetical protein